MVYTFSKVFIKEDSKAAKEYAGDGREDHSIGRGPHSYINMEPSLGDRNSLSLSLSLSV
jgi:hypothetical protein